MQRTNWPLLLGSVIILCVVMLAITGPALAPRDPLEENWVLKVGDEWVQRPFLAFTPGFPLGTDFAGRDLLSRLLWAIHPTLIMVTIVATTRLVLGVGIGLAAGWATGRAGRMLDTAIAAALTVPVLMIALGAIAVVGVDLGLLAFIVGLSVNGWAETAQLVRDQARIVKGQAFVETARALGESDFQILVRHVRRQIMPLVWMLFAFEISGTLMITASLGFLGYYIGGDVWIEIDAQRLQAFRTSGMPELGQMLATSWVRFEQPWAMFAIGSVIFIAILGFNLLGEGMRLRLGRAPSPRPTLYSMTIGRIAEQIETRVLLPVTAQDRRIAFRAVSAGALILLLGGSLVWWSAQASAPSEALDTALAVPGAHLWATERHDPWGTLWTPARGPTHPEVEWAFEDPAGFSGGPAVSADGTLYFTSKTGTLYALDPEGNVLWQTTLPAAALGTPALSAEGDIYVADKEGLSAFAADGELRWRFQPEAGSIGTGGPIVAPDGVIYYLLGQHVQALSPDGEPVWTARPLSSPRFLPPRLSPTGDSVFLVNTVTDTRDGFAQDLEAPGEVNQYITGADGRTYLLSGHTVSEWRATASQTEIIQSAAWDYRKVSPFAGPVDAGVTPGHMIWLHYSIGASNPGIIWLDTSGRVLGKAHYPTSFVRVVVRGRIIAVDGNSIAYACRGGRGAGHPECFAFASGSEEPIWRVPLEEGGEEIQGGALVPGRLYVTLEEGILYAIGESQP